MSTSTNGAKRGRGLFFSSSKSFSIALGWDWDVLVKEKDAKYEFIQLLDAIFSKRVYTPMFRYLIESNANLLGVEISHKNFTEVDLISLSTSGEIDKVGIVAKATGFDREFVESWNIDQIETAFANLGKSDSKKGILYLAYNHSHFMSRPTDISETFDDIRRIFIDEYTL